MKLHCDVLDLLSTLLSPEVRPVIAIARRYWITGGVTKEEMNVQFSKFCRYCVEKRVPLTHIDQLVASLFSYDIVGADSRSDNTMFFLDALGKWLRSPCEVQKMIGEAVQEFSTEANEFNKKLLGP